MELKYVYYFLMLCILGYVAYKDYRYQYIEDAAIFVGTLVVLMWALSTDCLADAGYGFLAGFVIHALLYGICFLIYKSEVYGQGDVLLMGLIGAFLGYRFYFNYLFLEVMGTGLAAVLGLIINKRIFESSIPMAPVYLAWLFIFIGLGRPDLFQMYFSFLGQFLS